MPACPSTGTPGHDSELPSVHDKSQRLLRGHQTNAESTHDFDASSGSHNSGTRRLPDLVRRPATLLTVGVVALACFNITYRLGRESVGEWDESLYATTAWEMSRSGDLIRTTFDGVLDYYNSKPPLNVWLIAASYKLFDVGLVSLRIPSACAALLTVVVFLWWSGRSFGTSVSLVATVVLATSFGFLHIHAARSGNPDALLTLAILLVVVLLAESSKAPWRRVWLGPLLGLVFLLKGMAVLQPLLLIVLFESVVAQSLKTRLPPLAIGAFTSVAIAGGWARLRWQVDGWEFLHRIVGNDFLALSLTALEGHNTGPLFYFGVLHRYQYEWLFVGALAIAMTYRSLGGRLTRLMNQLCERKPLAIVLVAWGVVTLGVPSAMQTRLAWYLNPFYPLFALLVGLAIVQGWSELRGARRARMTLIGFAVVALIIAESKSLWRLYHVTNLDTSVQGLLIRHVQAGTDRRVYRDRLSRAEAFVVRAILDAEFQLDVSLASRPPHSRPGDLVVLAVEGAVPGMKLLGRYDGYSVYQVK